MNIVAFVTALHRLVRYHLTTAGTSIGANLALTAAFVEIGAAPVLVANVAAVAIMSAANFLIADQWVFAVRRAAPLLGVVAAIGPVPLEAAAPKAETIAAWEAYVARVETRLHTCWCEPGVPEGTTIDVPGGAIHQWRASVFVPGATVDGVLDKLLNPGTPPPQEEVVAARVISHAGDALTVYMRLTRRAIVTVTYDTEHEVTFRRDGAGVASSRSVATRIREVDGRDRGFLWRLHSYWRYTQHPDGVRIDLESLSLSRRVPGVVKPAAAPLIKRVARESVIRTLEAVRRFLERPA